MIDRSSAGLDTRPPFLNHVVLGAVSSNKPFRPLSFKDVLVTANVYLLSSYGRIRATGRKWRVRERGEFSGSNAGLMWSSSLRIPKTRPPSVVFSLALRSDDMGLVDSDASPSHFLVRSTNAHCNKDESKQTRPRERNE